MVVVPRSMPNPRVCEGVCTMCSHASSKHGRKLINGSTLLSTLATHTAMGMAYIHKNAALSGQIKGAGRQDSILLKPLQPLNP